MSITGSARLTTYHDFDSLGTLLAGLPDLIVEQANLFGMTKVSLMIHPWSNGYQVEIHGVLPMPEAEA